MEYRIAKVPKGRGGFRYIYIVSDANNNSLRRILPYLEDQLASLDRSKSNFAFQKERNCALHALQHVGYRYTLSLDLENFFDSVTARHLEGVIHREIVNYCFIEDAPRQGLPTSPILATLAFLRCDDQIHRALKSLSLDCVYTRYADDLVFSFNARADAIKIQVLVDQIACAFGFTLNKSKRSLQDSKNGRRIITGIGVSESGLHPTRRTLKKIRAALHKEQENSSRGLLEWSKCKLPNALVRG